MARSRFMDPVVDVMTDSGSILWSFVKGEQLEYPVTLTFVEDVTLPYQFEAVIVEGKNLSLQEDPPLTIQPGGVQTTLNIRLPVYTGVWNAVAAYDAEDVVSFGGSYYRLTTGAAYTNADPPGVDPLWAVTALNIIYIQFPSTLASTWAVEPMVDYPVYGFFELRVTEPNNSIYVRTWKPVRGLVEILFSPTDIVP
jgi:hypothetical protein